jgi:hypothetical protein
MDVRQGKDTQMNRMIMILVVGFTSLSVTLGAAAEADKAAAVVSPCVALTSADSHVSERGYHRITSVNDWTRLWQKHKGQKDGKQYDLYFDPLGLPLVDFDRYMVIVVFQGSGWNSAGLNAVSVSEEQDRIVFRFDNKWYQTAGPDGGGKQVTVYGFFVIPRSPKPVILEENVQSLKLGKPAEWKECITFPKL